MARPIRPKFRWLIVSLFITTTAAIPAAYFAIPHVLRWRVLRGLTSSDVSSREKSLNYLIRHGVDDPKLAAGAIQCLEVADRDNFLQLLAALDHAGLWRRPGIPKEPWLRWITVLAHDTAQESRITAAQLLAAGPELASAQSTQAILHALAHDDIPDVRYNTLVAVCELLAAAQDPQPYRAIIASATDDPDPTIARHAWIITGLLNPSLGIAAQWHKHAPPVAEAILWATLRTHPDRPAPAIDALADQTVPQPIRAMAAYALHHSRSADATAALAGVIAAGPDGVTEENQVTIWRSILAIRTDTEQGRAALGEFLSDVSSNQADDPLIRPLVLAALTRYGRHPNFVDPIPPTGSVHDPLVALAIMEGGATPSTNPPLPPDSPPLLVLTDQATTAVPDPIKLRPLFASPTPAVRNRACVIAASRFAPDQNAALIESLLSDFNDDAKRSGAILAGLTGLQTALLEKKYRYEDIWGVKQIMALGLWMQNPSQAQPGLHAPSLLTRNDIPKPTVLLALLHRRHPAALDYLLNPTGEQDPDLIGLLDYHRWWPVLARYLPEDGLGGPPPKLWVWADPGLEEFQLTLLREWYLINRWRLMQESPFSSGTPGP